MMPENLRNLMENPQKNKVAKFFKVEKCQISSITSEYSFFLVR